FRGGEYDRELVAVAVMVWLWCGFCRGVDDSGEGGFSGGCWWLRKGGARGDVVCYRGVTVVLRVGGDGRGGVVDWWSATRDGAARGARGGEWIWGSGRSGHEDNIWFRPERSPENFSGGGGMVAGGGGRREGWPDNWGRWRRERGL
ncbi:hypothetical protein Tco_0854133, partial [Tanacetum coccineum]